MRVLQILPELNVGGVETGTVDFAKWLVSHRHKSVVVSNGGRMVERLTQQGSKHYQLPVHKKSLWTMLRLIKPLRKIIIDEKIDIVHARSRVPAWIAFFACRKTNAAFITTCHGYYKSKSFSRIMSWSKLIIVPSEIIGRHMIDTYQVPSESIRCIPRSVDLERFKIQRKEHSANKNPTVVMVGRLSPIKGHTYFLHAMAKVIRSMPYVRVKIIGDAPANKKDYKEQLLVLAKRLGIAEQVEFMGNRSDIAEILSESDALVLASIVPESFGRVVVEAQAVGVPVVATKVGGVVDIIDHEETGLLVQPKDVDAMAKEVSRLLNDKTLVKKMVAQAKVKISKEYTLDIMATRTLNVYKELLKMTNILVIKISAIGDVVLVTATLRALRKEYPHAKIYCLVGNESRKILYNCPYLDGLIVYDHKDKDKGWLRLWKIARKVRKFRFDKVIDFQNNRKSHLIAFLSLARQTYGFKNGKWSNLLDYKIDMPEKSMRAVDQQFHLLSQVGIHEQEDQSLELWPTKSDEEFTQDLLKGEWLSETQKIVGINLSASAKWQTKNWPLDYVAKLCDKLSAKNVRVLITGVADDKPLAQELLRMTKSKPANFVGKTDMLQLATLIKKCNVYLTPDSAPLHVAAAVDVPIISFFGPTSSQRHVPPAKNLTVLEKSLACAPCYSARCKILTHACMKEITVDDVYNHIRKILKI